MAHPNGAVYVRVGSDLALLEQAGDPDYDPARGPFARIACYRKSDNTPRWLDDVTELDPLVARFGEVIAYYDSDSDAFWCFHLRDGSTRALCNFGEGWELEGEPAPWEPAELPDDFDPILRALAAHYGLRLAY